MIVDVKVPVLAESVSEATLIIWHKKQGEVVKRGDNLIDIETDKVTLEVAAMSDGILAEIVKGNGKSVSSDEVIARIDTAGTGKADKPAEPKKAAAVPQQQSLPVDIGTSNEPKTSPAVRNMLAEHKLDAKQIPDSNNDGRLTKDDVVNYLNKDKPATQESRAPVAAKSSGTGPAPVATAPAVVLAGNRVEERVPMTRLRLRTAERLLSAQHENALLTTFNEVNMKPVMDLRAKYKDQFEKEHGAKLGFMSFFTRAALEALKRFPVINASIDGKDILL